MMIEGFLAYLRSEGRSPATVDSYRQALKRFGGFVRKPWNQVQSKDVAAYVEEEKKELAMSSVSTYITPVSSFYKWMLDMGLVRFNPTKGLSVPSRPECLLSDKISSVVERARVIASVKGKSFEARRDRAILETGCAFGARVSDLVGLDVPDVDLERFEIYLRHGKGGTMAVLPLTEMAVDRVRQYVPARHHVANSDEPALFVSCRGHRLGAKDMWRIVTKYTRPLLPPEKATPHAFFRHSTARQLIDGGAALTDVQALLRHKRVTTTQLYTKATGSTLRGMIQRCHPRAVL